MDQDFQHKIKVDILKRYCNPFVSQPWQCEGDLTFDSISQAIHNQDFCSIPVNTTDPIEKHISRIAYLVVHGWDDAISVECGIPEFNCYVDWIIVDGNHRFAATIYLQHEYINALIGGSLSYAQEMLEF